MLSIRSLALVILCCFCVAGAAFATGHAQPALTGPLAPFDAIVDGHTVSASLQPPSGYVPAAKVGEIQGSANGQSCYLQITRFNYASGMVAYEVALSSVSRTQTRDARNTVTLNLYTRRYLLKAMSDEIVLDTGFFLTSPRDMFRMALDPAGNITSVVATHYNGLGMKRLELRGAFNARVERFDTLHGGR
jgi:hypothetical protein